MNEQLGQEILQRIDLLAAKLGVAAEYLWEVLIRQQVLVYGWMFVGIGVVLAIIAAICARTFLANLSTYRVEGRAWLEAPGGSREERLSRDKRDIANTNMAVSATVGCTVAILSAGLIVAGVAHLLNPAYYAFRAIVGA